MTMKPATTAFVVTCLMLASFTCVCTADDEVAEAEGVPCEPLPLDSLTFCKSLSARGNWHSDKPYINALIPLQNHYDRTWKGYVKGLEAMAKEMGFVACQDCVDVLQHLTCAALVPKCGFNECLFAQAPNCTGFCQDKGCAEDFHSDECIECRSQCAADGCKDFFISRDMCKEFVKACACTRDRNLINEVCDYYSPKGYSIPLPKFYSCKRFRRWCSNAGAREGSLCPNSYMCLKPPALPVDPAILRRRNPDHKPHPLEGVPNPFRFMTSAANGDTKRKNKKRDAERLAAKEQGKHARGGFKPPSGNRRRDPAVLDQLEAQREAMQKKMQEMMKERKKKG